MKLNRRVTIITRFSGIMFSLLLLGGLAACSDDNNGNDTPEPEPSTYPTTPFSKIELKEVKYHYCRIQGPSSRDNRRSRYSINLHAE